MSLRPALATVLCAVAVVAGTGCGEKEEPDRVAPVPVAGETTDQLPKLPKSWRPYLNREAGFAIGLPRGWKPSGDAEGSTIRSFDKLVVLTISPDRSPNGLAVGVDEYAERAARALPGYRDEIEPSMARPFGRNYEAVEVRATATASATGVDQDISVIVLRREGVATFTIVIAANAKPSAEESRELAVRVAETLRTRAPRN